MLLLSMMFVGCKRKDVLPEPQADLIGKMKTWFETKTKAKNNKTTSADTTTWYPQWQDGIIQQIDANTRLALFPIHRKRAVEYFEIGFVRRLAIRIDAQGEVIDGQIIEMLSSKTYLQQHKNTIPLRYYQGYVSDSEYALVFKSVDNGRLKKDKEEVTCVVSVTLSFLECSLTYHYSCTDGFSFDFPVVINGGCGSPSAGGGIPPSGGWGTPVSPVGGGTPYIPIYNEYPVGGGNSPPTCTTCLSDDPGDNTNPPPSYISQELAKITKNWSSSNLSEDEWKKIDDALQKGLTNPILRKMYDGIVANIVDYPSYKLNMEKFESSDDPNVSESLGKYKDEYYFENSKPSKGISLNSKLLGTDPAYTQQLMVTLWAEMTHAYQNAIYQVEYKDLKNKLNIETEQRFLIEFVEYTTKDPNTGVGIFKIREGYSFYGNNKLREELKTWLEEIKNSPDGKPTLENVKQKYMEFFMPKFKEVWANTKYGQMEILLNEILFAILLLF